ncbi:MAG: 16S rRNA (cytosine(1402)-N(4))-methyltransferase RsmH [Clostridia bacterium]|nr:16S rRNA (cytosine(1402)-N(4))-methyltransferase RsmH [Clostridia bacterium]
MEFKHLPVMLNECLAGLKVKSGGVYFDGTFGGGGHSYEILKQSSPDGRLIATDRDIEAILAGTERLKEFEGRYTVIKNNFKNFLEVLAELNIFGIDGAILDLGVSSYQLDNRDRGFSYMAKNTRLDMRMDTGSSFSAFELVNTFSEEKLKYILSVYGEEKFAGNIAKNIILARKDKPIATTGELADICDKSIPFKFKKDGHPAKKTFQAIRIAVNEELDGLDTALYDVFSRLNKGGRLVVITFHSLEDRIVKNVFKDLETACTCDKRYPCVCNRVKRGIEITKKPITASENELKLNSRSKCAKLRIIEKL